MAEKTNSDAPLTNPPQSAAAPPNPNKAATPTKSVVASGGRNFRVEHTFFGAFEKGRVISEKMIKDMGYDQQRGVDLGALVETKDEVTDTPVSVGPDNPATGIHVSDGSQHPENHGLPAGSPLSPPHVDNTPAGTQGQGKNLNTGRRELDSDSLQKKAGDPATREKK